MSDIAKAKSCFRTCIACPSQWEGKLKDGRMFYIRYRHGGFTLRISTNPTNDVWDAINEQCLLRINVENDHGGCMEYKQMKELVKNYIDMEDVEENGYEN